MELQSLIPAEHRSDSVVVGVSPDPLEKLKNAIQVVTSRTGGEFTMTLLSDPQLRVIDQYGLRNESAEQVGMKVPHPTTYVIDKTGKIRWKFTEKNYAVRPSNDMILAELKKLW